MAKKVATITDDIDEEQARFDTLMEHFRNELVTVFQKNQESFEKQLSFISAGALSLSVGFIKDIVTPFKLSSYKGLLGWGWGLLVVTLLLNCVSHMLAAHYANLAIKEINANKYKPEKIEQRNNTVIVINWFTVGLMIVGIGLIISFIIYNTLL